MSDVRLGSTLIGGEKRDAIHVAIAPVVAAHELKPGEHIGLDSTGRACLVGKNIGIVDPFLKSNVPQGGSFYMVLYPNTVTGMRHHWQHSAFPTVDAPTDLDKHKAMIQQAADEAGITYDEIMEAAAAYLRHNDYLCEGGRWEGHRLPDDFWSHYEIVAGVTVEEDDRGSFFSCSC